MNSARYTVNELLVFSNWSKLLKYHFKNTVAKPILSMLLCLSSAAVSVTSLAQSQAMAAIKPSVIAAINNRLKQARPDFVYGEPAFTPFKGVYKVQVERGPLLYVSADGRHALQVDGEPYTVSAAGFLPWVDPYQSKKAKTALDNIVRKDMVVYPAKGKTKSHIYVFTDVHCGYCRKLHKEVPKLNEMGVEVRYLAFPRAGEQSESAELLSRAFCAKDRGHALTNLKSMAGLQSSIRFMKSQGKGADVMSLKESEAELLKYETELANGDYGQVCADHPIKRHMQLVYAFGIRGTPAIYLPDGRKVSGYRSADDLIKMLEI